MTELEESLADALESKEELPASGELFERLLAATEAAWTDSDQRSLAHQAFGRLITAAPREERLANLVLSSIDELLGFRPAGWEAKASPQFWSTVLRRAPTSSLDRF